MVVRELAARTARLSRRAHGNGAAAAAKLAGTTRLEHIGSHRGRRYGSSDDRDPRTRRPHGSPARCAPARWLCPRCIVGAVMSLLGWSKLPRVAAVVDDRCLAHLPDPIGHYGHRL